MSSKELAEKGVGVEALLEMRELEAVMAELFGRQPGC